MENKEREKVMVLYLIAGINVGGYFIFCVILVDIYFLFHYNVLLKHRR